MHTYFLHERFLRIPEPALWNKAYCWCYSVSVVAVCVCVCVSVSVSVSVQPCVCVCVCVFIVFHGMCVTCGCLWPGGMRGESE